MRPTLGLFGGTFDPIHIGHLRLALELKQQLQLDGMRLMPCHLPAHRDQPGASSTQRATMLQLALAACPELSIDLREVARARASYTVDSLSELRAELGAETSLVFCLGTDSFAGLDRWHRWQELLQLAHLVVVERPGWDIPSTGPVRTLLAQHQGAPGQLRLAACGSIVRLAPRLLPISATEIRQLIGVGQSPQFLVPDSVWQYIGQERLYR